LIDFTGAAMHDDLPIEAVARKSTNGFTCDCVCGTVRRGKRKESRERQKVGGGKERRRGGDRVIVGLGHCGTELRWRKYGPARNRMLRLPGLCWLEHPDISRASTIIQLFRGSMEIL
jgi:hypothetical protein